MCHCVSEQRYLIRKCDLLGLFSFFFFFRCVIEVFFSDTVVVVVVVVCHVTSCCYCIRPLELGVSPTAWQDIANANVFLHYAVLATQTAVAHRIERFDTVTRHDITISCCHGMTLPSDTVTRVTLPFDTVIAWHYHMILSRRDSTIW